MYVITGLGRSGTSFIPEILHNCGYYMVEYNPSVNAVFEHPIISSLNKLIVTGDYSGEKEFNAQMRKESEETVVVKDPRFITTLGLWLKVGAKINGVFLCSRNFQDLKASSERTNAGFMAIFNCAPFDANMPIMEGLEARLKKLFDVHGILFYHIHFSKSLEDYSEVECLAEIVKDRDSFSMAWEKAKTSGHAEPELPQEENIPLEVMLYKKQKGDRIAAFHKELEDRTELAKKLSEEVRVKEKRIVALQKELEERTA